MKCIICSRQTSVSTYVCMYSTVQYISTPALEFQHFSPLLLPSSPNPPPPLANNLPSFGKKKRRKERGEGILNMGTDIYYKGLND